MDELPEASGDGAKLSSALLEPTTLPGADADADPDPVADGDMVRDTEAETELDGDDV